MTVTPSLETRWWPSPFGADDQLGMLNHVDEAKRLEALGLVREGRLYDLGHELHEDIPVFPGRFFKQTLVSTAHHANRSDPVGENDVNWVTEQVSATMQLGTHLDALSHLQIGDRGYTAGRSLSWRTQPASASSGWRPSRRSSHAGGSSTSRASAPVT